MTVKKIIAKDTKSALKEAKELFGDDAIILSTKDVANGVELLVSNDVNANMNESIEEEAVHKSNFLQTEFNSLKQLLKEQFSRVLWENNKKTSPNQAMVIRHLIESGYTPEVVKSLTAGLESETSDGIWQELNNNIYSKFNLIKRPLIEENGIFAFWGLSGVGKTLTILKIATQFTMCYSSEEILLATTDVIGIGKTDLIKTFGEILNVPVRILKDADSIKYLLRESEDKRLVLIDTPTIELNAQINLQETHEYLLNIPDLINYGVIPANVNFDCLDAFCDIGKQLPISRAILTKVDEAKSLGSVVSLLLKNNMPLHYVCKGSRVPDDLILASNDLIKASLEYQPEHSANLDEADIARIFSKAEIV